MKLEQKTELLEKLSVSNAAKFVVRELVQEDFNDSGILNTSWEDGPKENGITLYEFLDKGARGHNTLRDMITYLVIDEQNNEVVAFFSVSHKRFEHKILRFIPKYDCMCEDFVLTNESYSRKKEKFDELSLGTYIHFNFIMPIVKSYAKDYGVKFVVGFSVAVNSRKNILLDPIGHFKPFVKVFLKHHIGECKYRTFFPLPFSRIANYYIGSSYTRKCIFIFKKIE